MRRRLTFAFVVAALAAPSSAAAATAPPTAFVLSGGGWGHGVGMSQWGAYGQAKAGRDYAQILGHYYRGTELGAAPSPLAERLRILVATGLRTVAVSSESAIAAVDGKGKRYPLPASVTVEPTLELPVGKDGAIVPLAPPVTLKAAAGGTLTYAGHAYRGELQVSKTGGRLQLVNVVGLETYLLGVVAREMPKNWPLEALKAQAVAARTYALAHVVNRKGYDLYSDWRSQLYQGVPADAPGVAQAVRETRGQILVYGGKPAQTFYFSSSGGRTMSALDAFGSEIPYLVAVEDPWDETSPNHAWAAQLLTGAKLAKRFGLPEAVVDVAAVAGSAGKPAALRLATAAGTSTEVRLSDVRARLGLKSTSFRLGMLRLDRPAQPQNGTLRLTGVARDVGDATLEQRSSSGWVTVKRLAPAPDGAFSVKVKHAATSTYRLSAGGLAGPALTVRAAP